MTLDGTKAGIIVGAGAGSYQKLEAIILNIGSISFEQLITAILYAVVGGAFGWLGSEIMSQLKKLYIKWKNKKYDKNN